jgi:deoxyhypusine synthase
MESAAPKNGKNAAPSSVTAAVLKPSDEMPPGSQKVEELDFNAHSSQPITVEELVSGMTHMGFQASSIGEAVRIINGMVGRKIRRIGRC